MSLPIQRYPEPVILDSWRLQQTPLFGSPCERETELSTPRHRLLLTPNAIRVFTIVLGNVSYISTSWVLRPPSRWLLVLVL